EGTPAGSRAVDSGIAPEVTCVEQAWEVETAPGIVHRRAVYSNRSGHALCWELGSAVKSDCLMRDEIADFMETMSTGVYVIGVTDGERTNAFTASSVMPVSFKPVVVAITVGVDHASRPLLRTGKAFTINVLKRDQVELASHFGMVSGRQA